MLLALWSPKGGSGTSVLAAASALVLARTAGAEGARLADLVGDQPGLLGLTADPAAGVNDWLVAGAGAAPEALERIAVPVAPGLDLLPAGEARPFSALPESGAALGVVLRDDPRVTVADVGRADTSAARALVEVADAAVVVTRGCYLALRRGVRDPLVALSRGVAFVDEPGRALGSREVADVLGVPVVASVPLRAATGRAVDAGVLTSRLPETLARAARDLIRELGVAGPAGRAA